MGGGPPAQLRALARDLDAQILVAAAAAAAAGDPNRQAIPSPNARLILVKTYLELLRRDALGDLPRRSLENASRSRDPGQAEGAVRACIGALEKALFVRLSPAEPNRSQPGGVLTPPRTRAAVAPNSPRR